jgi:DnaB-like helicase N terminal domain/AAA domain
MQTYLCDAIEQTERALLGSVLLDNSLWPQTEGVSADDFSLDSHRLIYRCMAAMAEDQRPIDETTLLLELEQRNELEIIGGAAYLGALIENAFPGNFSAYVRAVRKAANERTFIRLHEQLGNAKDNEDRSALLIKMGETLQNTGIEGTWRFLFHSYDEIMNAPKARFAIDEFLQEEGITLIGGLAGHGKTLCMLAMVRALLEGGKLFHHFSVTKPAERVIYLIPEAGLSPFSYRLKTFHLEEHVRAERLFCRTLSAPGQFSLRDSRLLEAVKGADVFLDTAIRFMSGDENSAAEQKLFAETLFSLQRAGARTITGAHHSPKNFGTQNSMTLENVLRGSGDIGAMLTTCWGLSQIDAASNRIFVQNVKARDFSPCEPFIIQGRPSLDETGYFELPNPPGFAGTLSDNKTPIGRPQNPETEDKMRQAQEMHASGKSYKEIADILNVPKSTVGFWFSKSKRVQ